MTSKQKRFCEEYIIDLNATQAAIRAGYSPKSAPKVGDQIRRKTEIAAEIARLQEIRSQKTGITAERVIEELRRLAFSDNRKLYREDGTLKLPHEWDEDTAAAVSGAETRENYRGVITRKIRLWDKKGALELLGKHLGLFKDRVELSGPDGGPVEVREVVVSTREEVETVLAALPETGGVSG